MTNKPKPYCYLCLILFIFLVACGQQPTTSPTKIYIVIPRDTSTAIPLPTFPPELLAVVTPSPLPTQPTIPIITPDAIQVKRWKEYQTELARVILAANPEIGNDPAIYKSALCEWDILGQSGQEVYVYGVCVGVTTKGNRDMRKPAIIYLEPDGSIQKAKIPEPKGPNSEMFNYEPFPKDVQEKFCYYFDPFPSDLPQCPYPYLIRINLN